MKKNHIFNKPVVYLITDGKCTTENFARQKIEILSLIKSAVREKISLIQIREKKLPAKLLCELAREAARITNGGATKILVNDRADIALAARADGVHLTANSISTTAIRRFAPKDFIIGVSAHNLEEAERARRCRADFITFCPIFPSPNKGTPQGLEKLREICAKLKPFPVIALGGINESNYKSVLESGAVGYAAIRFLNDFFTRSPGNI